MKAKPSSPLRRFGAHFRLSGIVLLFASFIFTFMCMNNIVRLFSASTSSPVWPDPSNRFQITHANLALFGLSGEDLQIDATFEEAWSYIDISGKRIDFCGRPFSRSDSWRWLDNAVRPTWPPRDQSLMRYRLRPTDRRLWRSEENSMRKLSSEELYRAALRDEDSITDSNGNCHLHLKNFVGNED